MQSGEPSCVSGGQKGEGLISCRCLAAPRHKPGSPWAAADSSVLPPLVCSSSKPMVNGLTGFPAGGVRFSWELSLVPGRTGCPRGSNLPSPQMAGPSCPYLLALLHPVAGLGSAMSLPEQQLPVTGFTCRGGLFVLPVPPLQAQGSASAAALLPGCFLGSPFLARAQAALHPPRGLLGFPGERGLLQAAIQASRDLIQEPRGLERPQRAGPPEGRVLGHGVCPLQESSCSAQPEPFLPPFLHDSLGEWGRGRGSAVSQSCTLWTFLSAAPQTGRKVRTGAPDTSPGRDQRAGGPLPASPSGYYTLLQGGDDGS